MKHTIVVILILSLFLASCKQERIVDPKDYNAFLIDDGKMMRQLEKCNAEIDFWKQKLQQDTGSFVNMMEIAYNILHRFKLKGNTDDLRTADSLFQRSNYKLNNTDPDIFYALSQNAITQHRFRDAFEYNETAAKNGGSLYTTTLLRFDAGMELGLYPQAIDRLERVKDKSSFDYLIRKAKWEDHRGNLNGAIELMEAVLAKVKGSNKTGAYCWALSNLADMYGHAGEIEKSYRAYLEVLKKDSTNLYCLRGIAWIAFSADHNTKEAKRILKYILLHTSMPELYLLLAEIEGFESNKPVQLEYINRFVNIVSAQGYGAMYNKYLITAYTEELNNASKALSIANQEIESRPTPETYSWLAWAYYKNGDKEKSLAIIKDKVEEKDHEPLSLLRMAWIYAANGDEEKAKDIFNECLESSFELGPVYTLQIKKWLSEH